MTATDRGVESVTVEPGIVQLDAESLCGPQFVSFPDDPFPDHVTVYRVRSSWGESVPCSPTEAAEWADAVRAYLDSLSQALEDLYLAHGGRYCEVDLRMGSRCWRHLSSPRRWPGWRRRMAERSRNAQHAFKARAAQAAEAYRPVREEIERRLDVAHAERQAAEQRRQATARRRRAERQAAGQRRQAAARRRREVAQQVGARRCWVWLDRADASAVFVYRDDVPPAEPVPKAAGAHSPPLTAAELDAALQELVHRGASQRSIEWEPVACAAVERECVELGMHVTFAKWWKAVADGSWSTRTRSGRISTTHATSHHSSHGVGGFDGGSYGTTHGTSF